MEGYRYISEQQVVWRDLDALGHVNNAVYATYLETARMGYLIGVAGQSDVFFGLILADLQISFKSPAHLRENLQVGVRLAEIRKSSFVLESQIVEKESGRVVVTSRAVLVHYDYGHNKARPLPQDFRQAAAKFEGRQY